MTTAAERALGRRYGEATRRLRQATARRIGRAWPSDVDRLEQQFPTFVKSATVTLTAAQRRAQTLTRAYVSATSRAALGEGAELPEAVDIAGTTKAGTIADGLGGIPAMVYDRLGATKDPLLAMQFGGYLVSRLADNEITRTVDTEFASVAPAAQAVGWEGVTFGPDDDCQDNEGLHDLGDEMFRHPGCLCDQLIVYADASVDQEARDAAAAQEAVRVAESLPFAETGAEQAALAATDDVQAAVQSLMAQAAAAEPALTADLVELQGVVGGDLAGLEFRLKGAGSMARKIAGDVLEGKGTVAEVEGAIFDSVRYTYEIAAPGYAGGYGAALEALEAKGYSLVRAKNFWNSPGYSGINSIFQTPAGLKFELQFHTPGSLAVKEPSHLLFEALRVETNPAERARLEQLITDLWAPVKPPPGATALPAYP